ncbi:MAG: DMT family transporter [Actinomycetota bacterium]|nr:DMT family transporter [Actinomycetota bacterium]
MKRPATAPLGVAAAFLALFFWGAQAVIAKGVTIDPLPLVFLRAWMAAVWSVGFLYATGGRLSRRAIRICVWGGIAFGFDLILFFTAIKLTTVANATVISSIQPVILVFAAPILFKERVRLPDMLWASLAVAGVAIVVFGSSGVPEWSLAGDFWALLTLFAWTSYFMASKIARAHVSAAEFTAIGTTIAAVVVSPFALLSGQEFVVPTSTEWFWIAMMAIGPGWAGHYLMNWALGKIPIWLGGTTALAVPLVSTVMAALFLDEPFNPIQMVGMASAIGALAAITLRSQATS